MQSQQPDLTMIRSQQGKIQQGLTRLIDSYAEGFLEKTEFEPRVTRLRQRWALLVQQAQQIQAQETLQEELHMAIHRLEEFGDKLKDRLAEADWKTRREVIRMLVKRVEIGKEEVKVVFRVPPDPDESGLDGHSSHYCWKRSTPYSMKKSPNVT